MGNEVIVTDKKKSRICDIAFYLDIMNIPFLMTLMNIKFSFVKGVESTTHSKCHCSALNDSVCKVCMLYKLDSSPANRVKPFGL